MWLRKQRLNCEIGNQAVHIVVTVTEEMIWQRLDPDDPDHVERLELRRKVRDITKQYPGEYEMTIRHLPAKFIRNAYTDRDLRMPLKPAQKYDAILRDALTEHGYVELTPEIERQIARNYCDKLEAIKSLEEQIEILQREKETHVSNQNFTAAAKARDLELGARNRLDSIVKSAANGS
jgi:DNA-binding transcriptional ArsR family regulator